VASHNCYLKNGCSDFFLNVVFYSYISNSNITSHLVDLKNFWSQNSSFFKNYRAQKKIKLKKNVILYKQKIKSLHWLKIFLNCENINLLEKFPKRPPFIVKFFRNPYENCCITPYLKKGLPFILKFTHICHT